MIYILSPLDKMPFFFSLEGVREWHLFHRAKYVHTKLSHVIFSDLIYTYWHKIVFNGLCFPLVSILGRVGVLFLFFQQNGIEALCKLYVKKTNIGKKLDY